jgi:hypothetical protein
MQPTALGRGCIPDVRDAPIKTGRVLGMQVPVRSCHRSWE